MALISWGVHIFSILLRFRLFARIFKVVAGVVIALGLLDTLSGRPVTLQLLGAAPSQAEDFRMGLVRACSVFPVSELFGTFCVAATAFFLYSERTFASRIVYVGLGIFGTVLSLSSGPLLALSIVLAAFSYDLILKKEAWRWKVLMAVVLGLLLIAFAVLNDPVAAIIGHLTFNPETGNFRIITWTLGLDQVALSPIVGRGFNSYAGELSLVQLFVGQSVDALWLLLMIRSGVPTVVFLLLTIFLPLFATKRISGVDTYLNSLRVGFTFVVILMSIIALTVHFWDAIWAFFGLCIGIRASFAELDARHVGGGRVTTGNVRVGQGS